MILTTTNTIEGRPVGHYLGIVTGEAVMGVNAFRDFFASIRDIIGGRSSGYQNALKEARDAAYADLRANALAAGADAIIGVDIDYQVLGKSNGMLMVSVTGTAVKLA